MFLKAAGLFIIFTYLITLHFTYLSLLFLYASLVSILLVSLASHPSINLPTILGKNADGSFPVWSLIIFSPYLYFVRLVAAFKRYKRKECPYSEVSNGLYVGGWPFSQEKLPPGNPAVIDCTCEFPRMFDITENGYLCIPTWDTRPPDPIAIESAVQWACKKRAQHIRVFIHCASGN